MQWGYFCIDLSRYFNSIISFGTNCQTRTKQVKGFVGHEFKSNVLHAIKCVNPSRRLRALIGNWFDRWERGRFERALSIDCASHRHLSDRSTSPHDY